MVNCEVKSKCNNNKGIKFLLEFDLFASLFFSYSFALRLSPNHGDSDGIVVE